MRPRSDEGANWPPSASAKPDEVLEGRPGVGIVPTADEEYRHVGKAVPMHTGIEARVPPVVVVVASRENLERPLLVSRDQSQLRLATTDRHSLEPVGKRRRSEVEAGNDIRRGRQRGLRVVRGVPERPGEKAKLEGAAVTTRKPRS